MQNPFDKLSQAESKFNMAQNQAMNPLGRAKGEAMMGQQRINRGTANIISALCYVTGIMSIIAGMKKEWRQDYQIHYHAVHARVLWVMILICTITIIGIPVAGLIWLGGFYLASVAVNGGQTRIPFLTQLIFARHWL